MVCRKRIRCGSSASNQKVDIELNKLCCQGFYASEASQPWVWDLVVAHELIPNAVYYCMKLELFKRIKGR